jgi:hypothetical protein
VKDYWHAVVCASGKVNTTKWATPKVWSIAANAKCILKMTALDIAFVAADSFEISREENKSSPNN